MSTEEFQPGGFDPGAMRAIGEQLGVEVEFVNLAFDGLGQALVLGQVDAAISAISETPERLLCWSISPRLTSLSVCLPDRAGVSPSLTVTANDDLQELRVAVQRGSIYEEQVQKTLVEPGLIPSCCNLLLYDDIAAASRQPEQGTRPMSLCSTCPWRRPMSPLAKRGPAQGVNEQRYAIALRKLRRTARSDQHGADDAARRGDAGAPG